MINIAPIKALLDKIGCAYSENQKLSDYTTFKIGGRCPLVVSPSNSGQISEIIKFCAEAPLSYYIVGKGSDLLINDDGLNAVVILLRENMSRMSLRGGNTVVCEAGASLASLCRFACENSLSGLEFAYGIPGTVGGAVYMNAGAYGGEIKDVFVSCDAVKKDGTTVKIDRESAAFCYRNSVFTENGYCITSAEFKLARRDKSEIRAKMDELMSRRKEKQPLEYPSAGSTFKRPSGNYASALIDKCGLRGKTIGGAQVSEKHCGFVINRNDASFEDVVNLIEYIKKTVYNKTGYTLECEVKIL